MEFLFICKAVLAITKLGLLKSNNVNGKGRLILVVLVLQIANVQTKYRETIIAFLETSDLHDKTNLFHWKHVIVTLAEYM